MQIMSINFFFIFVFDASFNSHQERFHRQEGFRMINNVYKLRRHSRLTVQSNCKFCLNATSHVNYIRTCTYIIGYYSKHQPQHCDQIVYIVFIIILPTKICVKDVSFRYTFRVLTTLVEFNLFRTRKHNSTQYNFPASFWINTIWSPPITAAKKK